VRRVERFIERALGHFLSRDYASAAEILMDHLRREGSWAKDGASWQLAMSRAWDREWLRFFGEAPVSRRRHGVLQHYTIAVLTGLATMLTIEGSDASLRESELDLLRDTLVRELGG
jgi:hypothetical protein